MNGSRLKDEVAQQKREFEPKKQGSPVFCLKGGKRIGYSDPEQ